MMPNDAQILLPRGSALTTLYMLDIHNEAHQGQDKTASRFRKEYFTPHLKPLAAK